MAERVKELEAELRRSKQDILTPPPSHEEKGVDILATDAFNDVPASDIGYFGPSSNHALFRCLATSFASDIMLLSQSQPANLPRIDASRSFPDYVENGRRAQDTFDRSLKAYQIPRTQDTLHLITRFFSTVGLVLPYVDKSSLVSIIKPTEGDTPRQTSRVEEALLSIICAYAALSTSTTDAYAYYQNTLNLLEERTLRGASLQLVQTLLLLCSFQQNTQRAIASWTYHALAVKAALQLGLQSSTSSDELSSQQCRLRKRVWDAIIIQDRNLSLTLGRPFLIPSSICQWNTPSDSLGEQEASSAFGAVHSDSVTYFNYLVAVSVIKGKIIEDLYDSNVGRVQDGNARDILVARLAIVYDLENWRRTCGISFSIPCFDDLRDWTMLTFHAQKFRVLLSLQYYGSLLSAYAPVLTAKLSEHEWKSNVNNGRPALADVECLAIRDDVVAAQELQQIIQRLFEYAPDFFDCYAVWWTCNYTSKMISTHRFSNTADHHKVFTVCLHLFSALLICRQVQSACIFQDLDTTILRNALEAAMRTLESIERTSLMSWKGRHCLERFLHVLDLLGRFRVSRRLSISVAID